MKTFKNPIEKNIPVGEFTYEGCRYSGIPVGSVFSVLSEGLFKFLMETFPQLELIEKEAPIAQNEHCCSRCGKDCRSKFMKERHEKVCKAEIKGFAPILKPIFIFWNYKNLDRTQLTPDQLIPENVGQVSPTVRPAMTEKEATQPAPGRETTAMIGTHMEKVTTDRDGVDWYGEGVTNDVV